MKPHGPSFWLTVGIVSLGHVLLIVFLLLAGYRGCTARRPPPLIPIEFMVAIPEASSSSAPPKLPPPTPPPPPSPRDIVLPEKKPESPKPTEKKPDPPKPHESKPPTPPPPYPKTPKQPFQKGRRLEAPPSPPSPTAPPLTPEEIRRLLDLGATPGNRTVIPSGDDLYFEIIRRTLYRAWQQPASAPPQLKVEVELTFSTAGEILARRMLRPSGHAEMDRSVMEAVQSVVRIDGLPPAFLARRRSVTVAFQLTAASP